MIKYAPCNYVSLKHFTAKGKQLCTKPEIISYNRSTWINKATQSYLWAAVFTTVVCACAW